MASSDLGTSEALQNRMKAIQSQQSKARAESGATAIDWREALEHSDYDEIKENVKLPMFKKMEAVFDYLDVDRDQHLSIPECVNAFKLGGVDLDPDDPEISDIPKNGCMNFRRFQKVFFSKFEQKSEEMTKRRSFYVLDVERGGHVGIRNFQEFFRLYRDCGLTPIQIELMFDKIEGFSSQHGFTYHDFLLFLDKSAAGRFHVKADITKENEYDEEAPETEMTSVQIKEKLAREKVLREKKRLEEEEERRRMEMEAVLEQERDKVKTYFYDSEETDDNSTENGEEGERESRMDGPNFRRKPKQDEKVPMLQTLVRRSVVETWMAATIGRPDVPADEEAEEEAAD